jgi:hypothetical protein
MDRHFGALFDAQRSAHAAQVWVKPRSLNVLTKVRSLIVGQPSRPTLSSVKHHFLPLSQHAEFVGQGGQCDVFADHPVTGEVNVIVLAAPPAASLLLTTLTPSTV